jgi:hypothetical protein
MTRRHEKSRIRYSKLSAALELAFGIALTAYTIESWLGIAAAFGPYLSARRLVRAFIGRRRSSSTSITSIRQAMP